jgi:hypothetical protein
MVDHELHGIIDFFRYVKKPRGEKKPNWKDRAAKWEKNCGIAEEISLKWKELYESSNNSSAIWEQNAMDWKKIALNYKKYMEKFIKGENLKELPTLENIVRVSSLEIEKPVDITNNYSGGWLAPNGDFYGMDGEYEDMIHEQLSDKMLELGLIPEDECCDNPDGWLADNGWVKIHFDWVLYDGYLRAKRTKTQDVFNMPVIQAIPMTDLQRKQIALYGKLCYGGVLKFGLAKNKISIARFEMIEAPMIWKLFDF